MSDPGEILAHDLVIVVPGIMGSTLKKGGKEVWAPSGGAVIRALKTFLGSIRDLKLEPGAGYDDVGDDVIAGQVMPDLHALPGLWTAQIGYGSLLTRMRSILGNDPLPFAYDWRLSNQYNGHLLGKLVSGALERRRSQPGQAAAKVVFVCHSMGGLVARWCIEKEGCADVTRKLITLGTPHRGSMNALEQLVNGVRKGIGPLQADLTEFARSLPSTYELLPQYACLQPPGRPESKLLNLTEYLEQGLPLGSLDGRRVTEAAWFHRQLDGPETSVPAYDIHPIVGRHQVTRTTACMNGQRLDTSEKIEGVDEGGDGTVPQVAATPKFMRPDSPSIRWVAEKHGSLQSNRSIFDELDGVLTARRIVRRDIPGSEVRAEVDEMVGAGDPVVVAGTVVDDPRTPLQAMVLDEQGHRVNKMMLSPGDGRQHGDIGPLPPGGYQVVIGGVGAQAATIQPVTSILLVWPG